MNKSDLKLMFIILILGFILIMGLILTEKKENKKAIVYFEDKEILVIDLEINQEKTYEVDGYNGKVKIIASNGKVKVDSENSPLNLCSKQGYISKSYETIVCLPNKITIKIDASTELDTIVK